MSIVAALENGCVRLPEPKSPGMTHGVDEAATDELMKLAAGTLIEAVEALVFYEAASKDFLCFTDRYLAESDLIEDGGSRARAALKNIT